FQFSPNCLIPPSGFNTSDRKFRWHSLPKKWAPEQRKMLRPGQNLSQTHKTTSARFETTSPIAPIPPLGPGPQAMSPSCPPAKKVRLVRMSTVQNFPHLAYQDTKRKWLLQKYCPWLQYPVISNRMIRVARHINDLHLRSQSSQFVSQLTSTHKRHHDV